MRLRLIAAAALAVCALTACTTAAPEPDTTVTVTSQPDPIEEPTLTDDMTQLVVDLSWSQQTETDKDAMCLGLTLNGPEWAAEQMQAGAGDSTVDWDRAAELVEQKCAER